MSQKKEYFLMYARCVQKYINERACYYLAYKAVEKWHENKYGYKMYSTYASFRVHKRKNM